MAGRRKTAFDRYVAARTKKSPEFAAAHRQARAEIHQTDALMRQLDEARERAHMTKAELARRAGMPEETVRRLFTAEGVNPELSTINRLAAELGLTLILKPK
ncbi:MAG TPA: helix-turn-helix transcriptional regulator [Polyangia bacterium]|jgi:DNA-binding phage protein